MYCAASAWGTSIWLAKPKALSLGVLNPLTSTYNVYTPRGDFLTVSSEF